MRARSRPCHPAAVPSAAPSACASTLQYPPRASQPADSPLCPPRLPPATSPPRSRARTSAREAQLIKADPRSSIYLACALLVRGDVTISDVNRNVARLRSTLRMPSWGSEGFKARPWARFFSRCASL